MKKINVTVIAKVNENDDFAEYILEGTNWELIQDKSCEWVFSIPANEQRDFENAIAEINEITQEQCEYEGDYEDFELHVIAPEQGLTVPAKVTVPAYGVIEELEQRIAVLEAKIG